MAFTVGAFVLRSEFIGPRTPDASQIHTRVFDYKVLIALLWLTTLFEILIVIPSDDRGEVVPFSGTLCSLKLQRRHQKRSMPCRV